MSYSKRGLHWAHTETYVFQFKFKSNKGSKKLAEGDTVGGRGRLKKAIIYKIQNVYGAAIQ